MRKMKKLAAGSLAACMFLLTACGGTKDAAADPGVSEGAGETAAAGDKIPLTLWHIQTGTMNDVIQASVDRFVAENPQYDVTVVEKQNDSYKSDLSLAINAGTLPDVFITWGGQTMYDYIDEGLIYDITDLMKEDGYADSFVDAGIAQCSYNGSIYAVPVENI